MGRILAIRLSASTPNEEDVYRSWPMLCALAWPEKGDILGGMWKPRPSVLSSPVSVEPVRRGVLELVHALSEEFDFADWDTPLKEKLRDGMTAMRDAASKLEKALSNWQPKEANSATDAIEDALDKMELYLE